MAARKRTTGMPEHIDPMLCTLIEDPPAGNYIFELKWDGYRIEARVEEGNVKLISRSGLDYTSKYPPVRKALAELPMNCILDGEVVVFDEEGKPDFNALQLYNGKNTPIRYCVFDIMWLDGEDTTGLPLTERKELLAALIEGSEVLHFSESFENGYELYQRMLDEDLEGIIAKVKDSEYVPGYRGSAWLKIPTRKRQEFVIGGWAESDKSRSFRSLLFGAYEDGRFTWIGRSGGGYKQKDMPAILKKLEAIELPESPFVNKILDTKGARLHFVKPELVANFEFAAWTKSGRIRKPATFLGFRYDKDPKDVVREVPEEIRQGPKDRS